MNGFILRQGKSTRGCFLIPTHIPQQAEGRARERTLVHAPCGGLRKTGGFGVGATIKTDPTARSDTASRLPSIIPAASTARHRKRAGKIQRRAVQSWGAAFIIAGNNAVRFKQGSFKKEGQRQDRSQNMHYMQRCFKLKIDHARMQFF